MMDQPYQLTKVVQTCFACPSQWDAWDAEGNYYYLRYRHGWGRVDVNGRRPGDGQVESKTIVEFDRNDPLDGVIDLEEFIAEVSDVVELAPNAEVTSMDWDADHRSRSRW